jgi:hypothetical protein
MGTINKIASSEKSLDDLIDNYYTHTMKIERQAKRILIGSIAYKDFEATLNNAEYRVDLRRLGSKIKQKKRKSLIDQTNILIMNIRKLIQTKK